MFLVPGDGYAWDEVHDEAGQLEHVCADRSSDRMDEMHGRARGRSARRSDSNAEGQVKHAGVAEPHDNVRSARRSPCTRVVDQDQRVLWLRPIATI
jgi:Mn-dependent DtxR family transcriptional regulator